MKFNNLASQLSPPGGPRGLCGSPALGRPIMTTAPDVLLRVLPHPAQSVSE